jgi:hypothetical protein
MACCLEKEPSRRYQTVGELAIALKDYGSRQARASVERVLGTLRQAGISSAALPPSGEYAAAPRPPGLAAPNTTASWGQTSPGHSQLRSKSSRKALVAIVAAVVVVTASVTGAAWLLRGRGPGTTPPSHATATASLVVPSPLPAVVPVPAPPQTVVLPMTSSAPAASHAAPKPVPTPFPRPIAVARGPAAAPAPPSCDPSFTLDDQGRKHWKPECFLK